MSELFDDADWEVCPMTSEYRAGVWVETTNYPSKSYYLLVEDNPYGGDLWAWFGPGGAYVAPVIRPNSARLGFRRLEKRPDVSGVPAWAATVDQQQIRELTVDDVVKTVGQAGYMGDDLDESE